jgi:hypothetical protein
VILLVVLAALGAALFVGAGWFYVRHYQPEPAPMRNDARGNLRPLSNAQLRGLAHDVGRFIQDSINR